MTSLRPQDVQYFAHLVASRGVSWLRVSVGEAELEIGDPLRRATADVSVAATPEPAPLEERPTIAVVAAAIGTFHRGRPGGNPLADPGHEVAEEQEIAMIRVLDTYRPVRSATAGTVLEVLVEDGAPVQAGDELFVVAPTGTHESAGGGR